MTARDLPSELKANLLRLWLHLAAQQGDGAPHLQKALTNLLNQPFACGEGLRFSDQSPEKKIIRRAFPRGLPEKSAYDEFTAAIPPDRVELAASLIVGDSPAIRDSMAVALCLAPASIPVLIHGETGSGKELFAHLVHRASPRAKKPFITMSCAAISESLLLSELFGYEPGAFTGAAPRGREGKAEAADGGTLFLDEIGELPPAGQAALLRFLDSGEIQKIGRAKPQRVSVRLICATNRDLEEQVRRGAFREDLFYRLALLPVRVPPLRERLEDIPLLIEHFLRKCRREHRRQLPGHASPALVSLLQKQSWPGNVRELMFTIERAFLFCRTERLEPSDVSFTAPALDSLPERKKWIIERLQMARPALFREPPIWADFLLQHSQTDIAASDVVHYFQLSEATVRIRLSALVHLGVLAAEGEKKGRRYRLTLPAEL